MTSKIDAKLYEILHKKLIEGGWENIRRFTDGSKVPFSVETTRRLFSECSYKGVAPATIAIVAKYLGFSANEIRDLLREYTTDRDLWPLIGDSTNRLTKEEEATIALTNRLKEQNIDAYDSVLSHIETVGKMVGINVDEVTLLRRK